MASSTEHRWTRLGAALRDRRIRDLGIDRLTEFSREHGIGYRILTDLEAGRRVNFASRTKAAVERAYDLPEGALDRVLSGEWAESTLRAEKTLQEAPAETLPVEPPPRRDGPHTFRLGDAEARALVTAAYDLAGPEGKEALVGLALRLLGERGDMTVSRTSGD
ncbi:hypothetical protein ABGB12_30415 [Actinocorallia sp. B10E7]|uniref:hypothetical protein n=1 Tax=Actinocorallia sp. B10E7 TaxID=3153558 RepID=UPI00325D84CC